MFRSVFRAFRRSSIVTAELNSRATDTAHGGDLGRRVQRINREAARFEIQHGDVRRLSSCPAMSRGHETIGSGKVLVEEGAKGLMSIVTNRAHGGYLGRRVQRIHRAAARFDIQHRDVRRLSSCPAMSRGHETIGSEKVLVTPEDGSKSASQDQDSDGQVSKEDETGESLNGVTDTDKEAKDGEEFTKGPEDCAMHNGPKDAAANANYSTVADTRERNDGLGPDKDKAKHGGPKDEAGYDSSGTSSDSSSNSGGFKGSRKWFKSFILSLLKILEQNVLEAFREVSRRKLEWLLEEYMTAKSAKALLGTVVAACAMAIGFFKKVLDSGLSQIQRFIVRVKTWLTKLWTKLWTREDHLSEDEEQS